MVPKKRFSFVRLKVEHFTWYVPGLYLLYGVDHYSLVSTPLERCTEIVGCTTLVRFLSLIYFRSGSDNTNELNTREVCTPISAFMKFKVDSWIKEIDLINFTEYCLMNTICSS